MAYLRAHRSSSRRRAIGALALVGVATVLAGCGTPATVKPVATPLPGLGKAVQAAKNVVIQSQQSAASYASTTP